MPEKVIEVPPEIVSQIVEHLDAMNRVLVSTEYEKTAALDKTAALERELDVAKKTLQLVQGGKIDYLSAMDKFAEFVSDPEKLEVFAHANDLGVANLIMGSSVPSSVIIEKPAAVTAEERYNAMIRDET